MVKNWETEAWRKQGIAITRDSSSRMQGGNIKLSKVSLALRYYRSGQNRNTEVLDRWFQNAKQKFRNIANFNMLSLSNSKS